MNTSENLCDKLKNKSNFRSIYRIISFDRVIELLAEKKNTLVEPYIWDDPLEGWIYNELLNHYGNPKVRGKFFGQSWTRENMSEPMWKIYSNGTDSVRIKSTIDDLKDKPLEKKEDYWCVQPINYKHFSKIKLCNLEVNDHELNELIDDPNQLSELIDYYGDSIGTNNGSTSRMKFCQIAALAKSYMIKRMAFKHENEVRLICYWKGAKPKKRFYKYSIRPNDFIKEIMMHPGISDSEFEKRKKILEAYEFNGNIRRSEIYKVLEKIPYGRRIVVWKANGQCENFDQDKLDCSIRRTMYKRPINPKCISKMISGIVKQIESSEKNEISSEEIRKYAMKELACIDDIAYFRFASFYNSFQDLDEFKTLITKLSPSSSSPN